MRDRHDGSEPDLPAWVNILDPHQRPIDAKRLSKEELIVQFQKRFVALLQKSGSDNSLDGWRDVAIDLAVDFHPAFRIKEQKAIPASGRPITSFRWLVKNAFLSRKRKLERAAELQAYGTRKEGKSLQKAAQAAREVGKEWAAAEAVARLNTRHMSAEQSNNIDDTPTAKTIQNLASERIPFPAKWLAQDYLYEAKSAARAAARRITEV